MSRRVQSSECVPLSPDDSPAELCVVSLSAQSMKVLRERVPLFAQFEDAELATIMHRSRRRVLKDGDVLIAEGTLATKLFVLVSGQAAVYRSLAGKSELIATLKPGATVGEIGIVDRAPRSAQVTAGQHSDLGDGAQCA